jgi:predicted RNA-binding Zn-ribbon protein involved in translation (DUF1610 family)
MALLEIARMERTAAYDCPQCGERILMFVDPGNGDEQTLIEDCQVCCKANEITVTYDRRAKQYLARAVAIDL